MAIKVKICGIRDIEVARAASRGDMLGFIMNDKFRRYISPEMVREIAVRVKDVLKVGVFVDQKAEEINKIAEYCHLDMVQLHGHESIELAKKINLPIIKAFRYGDDFSPQLANEYPAQLILIDSYSYVKKLPGGSGEVFNWQEAARDIAKVTKPVIIAGGINKDNAPQAIEIFKPYGIDVSGSLETEGQKDIKKIEEFLAVVEGFR